MSLVYLPTATVTLNTDHIIRIDWSTDGEVLKGFARMTPSANGGVNLHFSGSDAERLWDTLHSDEPKPAESKALQGQTLLGGTVKRIAF